MGQAVISQPKRVHIPKPIDLGYPRIFHEKYQLLGPIGRGAYSEVRRAVGYYGGDQQCSREYAVKILSKFQAGQAPQEYAKRISREIAVLTLLKQSPFAVKLYDVHEDEEHVYLVMKFLSGGSLHDLIRARGRLDEHTAALATFNILHGIRACNNLDIAHRDIKPANFVFAQNPETAEYTWLGGLKLIDFGFAVGCYSPKNLGRRVGTRLYLAPEVCDGLLTPSSDMWSAGITLYQMLAGLYPFWDSMADAAKCDKETVMSHMCRSKINYSRHEGIREASFEAKDFLSRLLERDHTRRLTATQALQHPWILKHAPHVLPQYCPAASNVVPLASPPLRVQPKVEVVPRAGVPPPAAQPATDCRRRRLCGAGGLYRQLVDGLGLAVEVMAHGEILQ